MIDLVVNIVQLIWPLIVMALGLIGVLFYGSKKKKQGVAEEKERSRRIVKKVQDEMDKETSKPRDSNETQKRLRDGTF